METYFVSGADELRKRTKEIIDNNRRSKNKTEELKINIPEDFKKDFFVFLDKVNLSLMEDQDNFYGYFLFQMSREIRFDISSPTAVNFQGANYVIYFNPILFLKLSINQMVTTIKHEILHIISMHLMRAKEYKRSYSKLAINMAMDIVVNKYLDFLPPYATTLEWVNLKYELKLKPYAPFEYYVEQIQKAIDLLEEEDGAEEDHEPSEVNDKQDNIEMEYRPETTHDLWEEGSDMDEKTMQEFTEKVIGASEKGEIPSYLAGIIAELKSAGSELPWNLYLNRLMGRIESNKKKTITRRNRRQPERLDLRGELRSHKAKIIVALDISGSISGEEFEQAMKEVLSIVRNYKHEITVVECDNEIRSIYKVKSEKDLRKRNHKKGGTKFKPVFEYANHNKANLLVYFTDGKGEDNLNMIPRGYHVLWVISGRGDQLSLKEPYGVVKKLEHMEQLDTEPDINEIKRSGYSMNNQESI